MQAIPQDRVRAELLFLKGIGRETADSILLYAFGFSSFVVDAYTMRLIERLPLSIERKYETVKAFFEQHLPCDEGLLNRYHALIVLNATQHCRKKPVCDGCPIAELCKTANKKGKKRVIQNDISV